MAWREEAIVMCALFIGTVSVFGLFVYFAAIP